MPACYGDLNDPGGVEVSIQSIVFALELIFIAFRGLIGPILRSDHDDKTVIRSGSTKRVCYRFFPVKEYAERCATNDGDHAAMILGGGARGNCPRSKHSMITMGLPQSGQMYVVCGGSGISVNFDAALSMTLFSIASSSSVCSTSSSRARLRLSRRPEFASNP